MASMLSIIGYFVEHSRYINLLGIALILLTAALFSRHKKRISLRLIATALTVQCGLAFFILKTAIGKTIFFSISKGIESVYKFADQGCMFVFGNLADANGPWGFVFAFKVLPIIIFFGALMALLYHLGIVQIIVKAIAYVMRPLFGTSGAETLSVAANSALGQTEAPLLIKNYLASMTDSEILTVMVSGMAHLSGSLLAVYGLMGVPILHLLSASIIAIPGAILISKILIPETGVPETLGGSSVQMPKESNNILGAISSGTSDGLNLAINVAAMLIAFISLMALVNSVLVSITGFSLDLIFAKLFYVVAYFIGIPTSECSAAGALLGQKLVINEFVAYSSMLKQALSDRSIAIITYALAGFSNFSCIGIQIGGIGAICPSKRELLTRLGVTALLGGTLTNLLTAAIAGLFI
jgi:CNT family concentrative nucleoside transporter